MSNSGNIISESFWNLRKNPSRKDDSNNWVN